MAIGSELFHAWNFHRQRDLHQFESLRAQSMRHPRGEIPRSIFRQQAALPCVRSGWAGDLAPRHGKITFWTGTSAFDKVSPSSLTNRLHAQAGTIRANLRELPVMNMVHSASFAFSGTGHDAELAHVGSAEFCWLDAAADVSQSSPLVPICE
ncbi:hypothetical protein [Caballeronia cordobensis]|uniref:hypothetical protein n=1 Tax=Caballeronia cordobensis TaxID=1353886 RepID=UPI000A747B9E|nr:hypothetical protein [Caballeronia cordobensis]